MRGDAMINEKENAVLLIAGFTQREINTQKQKFHNLFRVEPWLVPMRKHGEWQGLTDEELDCLWQKHHGLYGENTSGVWDYERAIEATLKEKNA